MLPSTSSVPNWSTAAATVATHSSRLLMSPVRVANVAPASATSLAVSAQRVAVEVVGQHLRALAGQPEGDCPPDSRARAGDERDLALEACLTTHVNVPLGSACAGRLAATVTPPYGIAVGPFPREVRIAHGVVHAGDRERSGAVSGPLTGITVIELAGLGALPFGTLKLADMGADVIRVDRAARGAGDRTRPAPALLGVGSGSALDRRRPQAPRRRRGRPARSPSTPTRSWSRSGPVWPSGSGWGRSRRWRATRGSCTGG